MSLTTRVTTVQVEIPGEFYGGFAEQYDVGAIQEQFVHELGTAAQETIPSLWLAQDGGVYVDVSDVDRALELDWPELIEGIDVSAIAARYER
jgi:hypothetical protein